MTTFARWIPCLYCEGVGYVEDVDDCAADWVECFNCEGTGDRFGRGYPRPKPTSGEGRD